MLMDDGASCGSPSMSLASSPPSAVGYVDLYGKRRQAARVQVLEREIGLLQDEIKSLGAIELASRSCKELDEFIDATPDPLTAINPKSGRSNSSKNFFKIIGRKFSCRSWMCCFCGICRRSTNCQDPRTSCCCDVKKTCSWRHCRCCKISCCCSFGLPCTKCSVCCCGVKSCCNPYSCS